MKAYSENSEFRPEPAESEPEKVRDRVQMTFFISNVPYFKNLQGLALRGQKVKGV